MGRAEDECAVGLCTGPDRRAEHRASWTRTWVTRVVGFERLPSPPGGGPESEADVCSEDQAD